MISDHASKAARDIARLSSLSDQQLEEVRKLVTAAILASVRETVQECRDAATTCCAHDSALTKQIREEIRNAESALVANLSSMR